jgi:5-oxopent-3-ene-1,2,5-tricarboxylate decarboxylase/2-hydroxyhepta-2,4-diene-1,7-dioate isomerase
MLRVRESAAPAPGVVVQEDSTDTMEWDMHYLVADLARRITLVPGDMIYSSTPANSRPVQPGDIVDVEVDGLVRLTNTIVESPTSIRTDVGAQPTSSEEVVSAALGGNWEFRGMRTPSKVLHTSRIEKKDIE